MVEPKPNPLEGVVLANVLPKGAVVVDEGVEPKRPPVVDGVVLPNSPNEFYQINH